ncbi:hypothetical protein NQD34_008692, partial [Periophthalmus magnuspinnatus]
FCYSGETVEEQRQKAQGMNIAQPSTNVIVQPSKVSKHTFFYWRLYSEPSAAPTSALAGVGSEPAPTLPDLLGDIPFTLAPHILAMQAGFPFIPDVLLSRDINYNLSNFQYDFTLENSVIHNM